MDNLEKNGETLRKVQSPKTEIGRNRKYEQANHKFLNRNWLKVLQQTKVQGQTASQVNSVKYLEKA